MTRYTMALCGATVLYCGVAGATLGLTHSFTTSSPDHTASVHSVDARSNSKSLATTAARSKPHALELPPGTVIRDAHVLASPGAILLTVAAQEGFYEGHLRTLGNPIVDGAHVGADQPVVWGSVVDFGAFYNASDGALTIVFASGLIIDLGRGEVVVTSTRHDCHELIRMMTAGKHLECFCRCECWSCDQQVLVACEDVAFTPCAAGDCECYGNLEPSESCEVEDDKGKKCQGDIISCERIWRRAPSNDD